MHSLNFENKNVHERVCFICHDQIEDEKHDLLDCPLYADLRERLFNEAKRSNVHFIISSDEFCHNSETPIFLFINSISNSPSKYFVIHSVRRHNITSSPVSKNTTPMLNTRGFPTSLHTNVITQLEDFLFDKYKVNWQNRMFSQKVGNKLRTYILFKEVFETEMYLSKNIPSYNTHSSQYIHCIKQKFYR
jgi:hypothetical protein